jgi:hypothetical protein
MERYKRLFLNAYLNTGNRHLKVLDEAVIHVKKYLDVITILLDNEKSTIIKTQSLEDKIKLLNTIFLRYKIQFDLIDSDDRKYGIVKGSCYKENITIYFNELVFDPLDDSHIFDFFKKELLALLGHELVHRGQYYVRQGDFLNFIRFEKPEENNYTQKQEIMAYAYMGIENMRYKGFADQQIIQKIQSGNVSHMESGIINVYISDIKDKDEKAYKKFIKYVIEYLVDPIRYELKVEF